MQTIFRKRVWRNFKENVIRYLALGTMIIMGIHLIVSMVGAAETVIVGVKEKSSENNIEDGEFSVFIPLTEKQEHKLTGTGIELEKLFYQDFTQKDESTLRIYQNRESINRINMEEGKLATAENEVVLERRYCEEHNLSVGYSMQVGNTRFHIVGIATAPDYDATLKNLSDSNVDSKMFGLAFVSKSQYEALKENGTSNKSEEYVYGYKLNNKMTDQQLKEKLHKIKISDDDVADPYFKDYWNNITKEKTDFEEGIQALVDGSNELKDALNKLSAQNNRMNNSTNEIVDNYLKEANKVFSSYGWNTKLTEDNYNETIIFMEGRTNSEQLKSQLSYLGQTLNELKQYRDGVHNYTDGVSKTAEGSKELSDGMGELKSSANQLMNTYFDTELTNLTMFLTAEDNPRIGASMDDMVINKMSGLVSGIIVMVLLTYVISVFVIHEIEQESAVIGALYSLGVKKKDLIIHYLMLPVFVTFFSSVTGMLIGFSKWGVSHQLEETYAYFSIPKLQIVHPVYLIIYAFVMPVAVAILVNLFVIHRRLSLPALKLMRKEQKNSKVSNVNLGNLGFVNRFRIRQMIKEIRTSATVIAAMFISLLIMMIGIDCYVMCKHISDENKRDTKFEYMYTYKYPEEVVHSGGEAAFLKTFKKEIYSYNLDVSLLGIDHKNPYFDADVIEGKNKVVISSAMAQKFHLSVGDSLILSDEDEDMDYAFQITGITQYSVGMYAFMEIGSMRELFREGENYYNVVFSDNALDIESGRLYAEIRKQDISDSSDVFIKLMMPMVSTIVGVSLIIFAVVLYMMVRVMIERSSYSISLIKIFGYRNGEIRKLYLNGNFYTIALGAVLCIPLSKRVIDSIYPLLVSNISCSMNLTFSWQLYLGIYIMILILYFIINQLLVRRINKIIPAEVLKNKE